MPARNMQHALYVVMVNLGALEDVSVYWRTQERPLTCLWRGFLVQRIYTRPFLRTTLQPSHMILTEDRTFMPLLRDIGAGGVTWWRWGVDENRGSFALERRGLLEESSALSMAARIDFGVLWRGVT